MSIRQETYSLLAQLAPKLRENVIVFSSPGDIMKPDYWDEVPLSLQLVRLSGGIAAMLTAAREKFDVEIKNTRIILSLHGAGNFMARYQSSAWVLENGSLHVVSGVCFPSDEGVSISFHINNSV